MKKLIFISIVLISILQSCVTTKLNSKNKQDYSKLKIDSEYIIKTVDDKTFRKFQFKGESGESIIGVYKNSEIQIEKTNIKKIKKFSYGKTVPLSLIGVTAVVLFIHFQNYTLLF